MKLGYFFTFTISRFLAKKVVKLLQADPELARLAKETGEASEKLRKALKKLSIN